MEKGQNFVIDDGLRRFTFTNNIGEVFAEFAFNPADTSILERYDKTVEAFNNIELKGDTDEETKAYIIELSDTFKKQFNYLLNREVSDGLFKVYSPVTVFANGDFYAEVILDHIAKAIEQAMNVRLKKKAKKIEKYTKNYK